MGCCGSKSKNANTDLSKTESSGHSKDKTKHSSKSGGGHSPHHTSQSQSAGTASNNPPGYKWVKCRHGDHPAMRAAVKCGGTVDPDGSTEKSSLLVARAHVDGGQAVVPGYFDTRNKTCFIAWGGRPIEITDHYEILVRGRKKMEWVPSKNGYTVHHAVLGGQAEDGERLFVGRAGFGKYNDEFVSGRVHPSHKRVYVPHQGLEVSRTAYEILVEKHY